MDDKVLVFDTTLRDGEQSPGIHLDQVAKVEIATQLAALGVDVIEAGFPAASDGDFDAVSAVAAAVGSNGGPIICGLARTRLGDIDRCAAAVAAAERSRIHVFIATSERHMVSKLKMTPDQVLVAAAEGVAHAAELAGDVQFSPEDASRSDFGFMCDVLTAAVENGATTLNIPDTVGWAVPGEFAARFEEIRRRVPGTYRLSAHCHDDLGMAVANTLAAVSAGARQVEVAVNGIGERAGNAALEEVVMALAVRPEHFGVHTDVVAAELARTSRLVARLTGYPVAPNKAVVGANAFAHESGIHAHGVLEDPRTYEIMDPTTVGVEGTRIVLGKHSGRASFINAATDAGLRLPAVIDDVFAEFKALADRKGEVSVQDLEALLAPRGRGAARRWRLDGVDASTVGGVSSATVRLIDPDGAPSSVHRGGDGMVDAACAAIAELTGAAGNLVDYRVTSVTGGVDALADVSVRYRVGDRVVTGTGLSTDVVTASAEAFLDAINAAG